MTATQAIDLDTQNPDAVIDAFHRAAEANLATPGRRGNVVELPAAGSLLMTGDLHDHGLNFHRILKHADLAAQPDRHLILHEIIHGPGRINGRDLSVRLLARVAALKLAYPDRVHFLQANHDLAQMLGEGILKDGISVVEAYEDGLQYLYDDRADDVRAAMNRFIRSFVLAVRCANGILCCHSLPAPRKIDDFDPAVLERVSTEDDLEQHGSAYLMVWGRHHTQKLADELGGKWNVRLFVMGHQPAEMGYEVQGTSMLVLASDHDHGVVLPIDLSRMDYDLDALIEQIVPLAAIVL